LLLLEGLDILFKRSGAIKIFSTRSTLMLFMLSYFSFVNTQCTFL